MEEKQKKKVNLWFISFLVIVIAFCIVIWEGGQYYYNDWKSEIYDTGYNQSYRDTIEGLARNGIYPSYWQVDNGSELRFATYNQLCGVE